MNKTTKELENTLLSVHKEDISDVLKEEKEDISNPSFSEYMKNMFKKNGLLQQEVFLRANIPERYGYKIISCEKHTIQRDVVLSLCIGARFTLEETDKALVLYNMAPLYARNRRDAILIVAINKQVFDIDEINKMLLENQESSLRVIGTIE